MLKRLAKTGIFIQISVAVLLTLAYFITPQAKLLPVSDPGPTAPLGEWIYVMITSHAGFARSLGVVLIVCLSFGINALLIRHDISPRQSLLPAIITLILMLFTPDSYHLIITLSCLVLLLISLHSIMGLYGQQYPYGKVLNATFSISVASMISPPVIVYAFFVWFGFFTFRINSWREWAISFMGLILPYFYLAMLFLWNDNLMLAINLYVELINNFSLSIKNPGLPGFISLGLFAIWIIISGSKFLADTNEKLISIRKKMWIISHFTLAGVAAALLSGEVFIAMLPLIYIPASAIIAHAVSNSRHPWIHDTLLVLSFAAAVINRIFF